MSTTGHNSCKKVGQIEKANTTGYIMTWLLARITPIHKLSNIFLQFNISSSICDVTYSFDPKQDHIVVIYNLISSLPMLLYVGTAKREQW